MSGATDAGLSASQLAQIPKSGEPLKQRTQVIKLDKMPVVVKGRRAARWAVGYHALDLLAWLSRQPWLRGVPLKTGAAGQEAELRRLRTLAQAGVVVPRVLHVAPDYFVMSYAHGTDLASMLPRDPALIRPRWNLGLDFLRQVHAAGQYLSQAFARNLILSDRGIVAVDFEDDPLQVMTLHDAQTRDWLAYLHSTAWRLPLEDPWVADDLVTALEQEPAGVRQRLLRSAARWSWLRALPSRRERWGRDLIGLQALGRLLLRVEARLSSAR